MIDHSVQVDVFGTPRRLRAQRGPRVRAQRERYAFLRWGQNAFENFAVVPPDTGIVPPGQPRVPRARRLRRRAATARCRSPTPTRSSAPTRTRRWSTASACSAGASAASRPRRRCSASRCRCSCRRWSASASHGALPEGATATDLVLTVTEMLRAKGVVGRFVEFFGAGLAGLPLADRATIGNMSPEFGSTVAIFPIDAETLRYLRFTGRPAEQVELVEAYAREQGLWHDEDSADAASTATRSSSTSARSCRASPGPRRPQDRVPLRSRARTLPRGARELRRRRQPRGRRRRSRSPQRSTTAHVVIAAITSCTNTSNPSVMVAAGLLARDAVAARPDARSRGSRPRSRPGSRVVTDYLERAGLTEPLEALGFNLVGYGCTTCIGNSGPLAGGGLAGDRASATSPSSRCSRATATSRGASNPRSKMNYLASPPLVVAYALAGHDGHRPRQRPARRRTPTGEPVYLRDIWPTSARDRRDRRAGAAVGHVPQQLRRGLRRRRELAVARGPDRRPLRLARVDLRPPPAVLRGAAARSRRRPTDIAGARVLAVLGDSVTTDHISPAGSIKRDSPAGRYLQEHGVAPADFNSYGARRGNHEVMVRGTFANIRLRNLLGGAGREPLPEGGFTRHLPDGESCRSTTPRCATRRRACRSSCSAARSTAPAPRATGRPRARACSACAP